MPTITAIGSGFSPTDELDVTFSLAVLEYYREFIGPVPGAGRVRGVALFNNEVYAFRNSVDNSACNMFRATPTGWAAVTTPALAPNGQYFFRIGNFQGSAALSVLVGVDGVNKAFKFDGTTFTQLSTAMPTDNPNSLAILASKVLVLGYANASLMTSKAGDPTDFTAGSGGSEIAVSDEIVADGLHVLPNNTLAIFCRRSIRVLYGSTPFDFGLTVFDSNVSVRGSTMQSIGDPVFVADRGLNRLARAQEFGNFQSVPLSVKVKPILDRYRGRESSSFTVRGKNQYRLCMEDGTGVIFTFVGIELAGASTFDYGIPVRCAFSGVDESGEEWVLFGSDDGFVYRAEIGNTFDGRPIPATLRPAFDFMGSPENRKRFKKAMIEVEAPRRVNLTVIAEEDYSGPEMPAPIAETLVAQGDGGYFNDGVWNDMYWSTAAVNFVEMYLDGVGRNISLAVFSESLNEPPHTINSMMVHWAPRTRRR